MAESRHVVVDDIRTHYLEAGSGPTVVLLHGGAPGDCAEASWERNVEQLATRFRVLAPDWIGFGETDKVRDFSDPLGKPVRHLARLLETLRVGEAAFVGLSMGGTLLVRDAASEQPRLPARKLVLVSGGGFSPDNDARRSVQSYDGTIESMRAIVRAVHADPSFAEDDEFVSRRQTWSLLPGAFEHFRSLGLRPPAGPGATPFGAADPTPYEHVSIPTLITAGADDPLREPGYADELGGRIPGSRVVVFEPCGHVPNLEHADTWNDLVLDFLSEEA